MPEFTANPTEFKYKTTRRGVNATCPIHYKGSAQVTLHDVAESIVAQVDFKSDEVRKAFLIEARAAGHAEESDNYAISEYARSLTMAAEAEWMAKQKK